MQRKASNKENIPPQNRIKQLKSPLKKKVKMTNSTSLSKNNLSKGNQKRTQK